mmetsp:Transcript_12605/g.45330  ORF Transcript_12605/g.45330 Transcript_12605/m.45330 type:complete len:301 (+) Transcript_12605:1121-2023(+)
MVHVRVELVLVRAHLKHHPGHVRALLHDALRLHGLVVHPARGVPRHLAPHPPGRRRRAGDTDGGVRRRRRERRGEHAVRDVVPAHLPRAHVRAAVADDHDRVLRPRRVAQVPGPHHGVLLARCGDDRSRRDLARELPLDRHGEDDVQEHRDRVHGRVPDAHAGDAHEPSHGLGLRRGFREAFHAEVVHEARMPLVRQLWSREEVGDARDALRAVTRDDARASRDRALDSRVVVVRDVALDDLQERGRRRVAELGRELARGDRVGVARHDADAHAAVDERGDEAPPDAPGAADDEDDLVGF